MRRFCPALAASQRSSVSALIVHRARDVDGLLLVDLLRKARPTLPILFVAGIDRRTKAVEAGASAFLHYNAWLNSGNVVED